MSTTTPNAMPASGLAATRGNDEASTLFTAMMFVGSALLVVLLTMLVLYRRGRDARIMRERKRLHGDPDACSPPSAVRVRFCPCALQRRMRRRAVGKKISVWCRTDRFESTSESRGSGSLNWLPQGCQGRARWTWEAPIFVVFGGNYGRTNPVHTNRSQQL